MKAPVCFRPGEQHVAMEKTQNKRRRTISDRLIANLNSLRFRITEPLRLRLARARYDRLYDDPTEEPLISICVPTYNRGPILIERAVGTALAQSYKNFELIVVGDHCTDNTMELLSQIKDPRLHIYNLPERKRKYPQTVENHWFVGGAVPANKAMEMARGKWIARNDDDDIWTPDHLEKLLRFAQAGRFEFVSAAYIAERHGTRKVVNLQGEHPTIGGVQTWLFRSYLKFMKYNVECWRKSWNRVWDADLQDRIYKAGVRTGFLDEVVAYVLPRPGEKTVGLEAYRLSEKEKLEHFKF